MDFLNLFHSELAQWWLTTGLLRRMGDLLVACMAAAMLFAAFGIWRNREILWGMATSRLLGARFDRTKAEEEIEGFFATITGFGALAAYVLAVDLPRNVMVGVVAWAGTAEKRVAIEAVAREVPDCDLIGGEIGVAEFLSISEARPFWLPSGKLIIPIPPVYRAPKAALLVVHVGDAVSDQAKGRIEKRALDWAHRVGGTGR